MKLTKTYIGFLGEKDKEVSIIEHWFLCIKWFIQELPGKIFWYFLHKLKKNTIKKLYKESVNEIYLPNSYDQTYQIIKKDNCLQIIYRKPGNYSEGYIYKYEE